MPYAQAAEKIVCIVSEEYLKSPPCGIEFQVAESMGKLMVIAHAKDIPSFKTMISQFDTKAYPQAASPQMFALGGGQVTASGCEDVVAAIVGVMLVRDK